MNGNSTIALCDASFKSAVATLGHG